MLDKKKLLDGFSRHSEKLLISVLSFGLLWTIFVFFSGESSAKSSPPSAEGAESYEADRMIPEGFVLIPLEFENHSALASLLADYGVLNIYQSAGPEGKRGRLIAKNVKVFRAPLNPQSFAVLVPEPQAVLFTDARGGFFGVVQRKDASSRFSQAHKRSPPLLQMEEFENKGDAE